MMTVVVVSGLDNLDCKSRILRRSADAMVAEKAAHFGSSPDCMADEPAAVACIQIVDCKQTADGMGLAAIGIVSWQNVEGCR